MTYEEKLIREYHKQKHREEVNSGHYNSKKIAKLGRTATS